MADLEREAGFRFMSANDSPTPGLSVWTWGTRAAFLTDKANGDLVGIKTSSHSS